MEDNSDTCSNVSLSTDSEDLLNLLKSWDLECMYEILKDQEIFIPVLKVVKLDQLPQFLKDVTVGKSILFEHHLKEWRRSIHLPFDSTLTTQNELIRTENNTQVDLDFILKSSKNGNLLIDYYEKHNCFKEEQRNALINVIGSFIYENKSNFTLKESIALENEIISKFPSEKIEFYRTTQKGRLYIKVCNLKSAPKRKGMELSKILKESNNNTLCESYVPEPSSESIRQVLKYDKLNLEELESYWSKCHKLRFKEINEKRSIEQILELWPQYKTPLGFRLVELDFNIKYEVEDIYSKWALFSAKIEDILKKKLSKQGAVFHVFNKINSNMSEDSKNLILFWCLHNILKPGSTQILLENGKKIRNTFTVADSQNSFVIIAENEVELEEKLAFLKSKSMDIPCIVVIGTMEQYSEIYVYFHKVRYPFNNFVRAVDICFKIMLNFNIKYPQEAVTFWTFMEHFFYKLSHSKINSKIAVFCNEIENM